jgi:serine phosphatase RsbU (regulator of sigma subunit)
MLGIAFLNEIVNKTDNIRADQILGQLRENIIDSLHQEHGMRGSKDGMDMAMCIIDKKTREMEYAGAYNPVYIVRDGELIEIKADKMPIGIHAIKVDKDFERKIIKLESGDMLYLFSDGYVDQFGGKDGMKFKQKAFKELLIKVADKDMNTQLKQIDETMKNWQGDLSQLDDMMIMGIRV